MDSKRENGGQEMLGISSVFRGRGDNTGDRPREGEATCEGIRRGLDLRDSPGRGD